MEYNVQELVIDEFEIIDKDLRCLICMCLIVNPLECSECQHDFCKKCIEQTYFNCPYKCPEAEFQESHRRTRGMLSSLILRCPNFQRGCQQKIKMDQINTHIKDDCEYLLYQCNNKGCVELIYDFIKQEHNKCCKYKVIKCIRCQQLYKQFNYHNCLKDALGGLKRKQQLIKSQQKQINQLQAQVNNLEETNKNLHLMSQYKCKKFHKLKWFRFQQPRTCEQCCNLNYSCYCCYICDERYCIICRPIKIIKNNCIEGHPLKYYDQQATCTICLKQSLGIVIDEVCKLNICMSCYHVYQ